MKNTKIETDLLANAESKKGKLYISCEKVFEVAGRHTISRQEAGKKCNELKIKIMNCQLGCF